MDSFIILICATIDHQGQSFKRRTEIALILLVNEFLDETSETFELRVHGVLMLHHVTDLLCKSKHHVDGLKSLLWLLLKSCGDTLFLDWSALSRHGLLNDVTDAHFVISD